MTPDEIARIGVDEALFFLSKQNVLKDKKFDVNDHKQAKRLSDGPQDDNWYTYRRYMNDIEEWFENVDQTQIIDITEDVMAA